MSTRDSINDIASSHGWEPEPSELAETHPFRSIYLKDGGQILIGWTVGGRVRYATKFRTDGTVESEVSSFTNGKRETVITWLKD
jgi:hypothetical protein